jgi:SAM-dependent methyltransferase
MSNWTAGYKSDIEYTGGYYREQSPSQINFACVINDIEPIPLDAPFTYCELGFGRGLTVNLLAAAHPQGRFYACDFNPAHVAGARRIAEEAGLNNLTLLEASFAEMADGRIPDLPKFDFITLHGIYTWIAPEIQRDIVRFIAAYLKPGGVVYSSYNAMPGWTAALPLQRLLVELAELKPNRSDIQIRQGAEFVQKLGELQAGYLNANPAAATRIEMLKTGNPHYLVHEYMHRAWRPLYFADVARDFAAAKLEFVGSADTSLAFANVYLKPEQTALLNELPDSIVRETVKDYLLNTGFRKDVFVRGSKRMTPQRQLEWLRRMAVALIVPRKQASLKIKLAFGELNLNENTYAPIIDVLGQKPMSFQEIAAMPSMNGQSTTVVLQFVAFLVASNQAAVYFQAPAKQNSAIAAFNRAVAKQTGYNSDEFQFLAAPLIAGGVQTNFVERLVYSLLAGQKQPPQAEALSGQAWQVMKSVGRSFIKDGAVLKTDEENRAEMLAQARAIIEDKLPLWKRLGVI